MEDVARGAFLETHKHARLITYDHLDDLFAAKELGRRRSPPIAPGRVGCNVWIFVVKAR
jgi:hypothetical protein